jgi:glycosyltransferase involved in cell wall biosynthesis
MKRYLKKFLEELPAQTYFDKLEVVLDHNEPDEEEIAWVKEFQEKYPGKIKHIIVPKVEPIGASMNRCIREAQGDFMTIWNVDDLRTPWSIEAQAEVLLKNPDIGISYGNIRNVRSFGSKEGELVDYTKYQDTDHTRGMTFGPYVMFRKSLVEKAGYFDDQMRSGADYDLSVRLAFNAKAQCANRELGYYLNEGMGASTRPGNRRGIDQIVIAIRYGIFDKIDYGFIKDVAFFDVAHIYMNGERIPVEHFVPNYREVINERYKQWFTKGIINFIGKKILRKLRLIP